MAPGEWRRQKKWKEKRKGTLVWSQLWKTIWWKKLGNVLHHLPYSMCVNARNWVVWEWKWSRSVVSDSLTPWTVAYQAPLSMDLSRQEFWSGLPFPSPGGHPDPGIEPRSPTLQADALPSEPLGKIHLLKIHLLKPKKWWCLVVGPLRF